MKVYLTTAYEDESAQLKAMRKFAEIDKHKHHTVVESPEYADLILFVENHHIDTDPFYSKLLKDPILHKFRTKSLLYNDADKPHFVIPGLYVSLNKQNSDLNKQMATIYLREINELIDEKKAMQITPHILYSFMGARTALVREKLLAMEHSQGIVIDTSDFKPFIPHLSTPDTIKKRKEEYSDLIIQSKFILCPRGAGTSSYRLYETMQSSRVPVIISDHWVPPEGPNWNNFAVFIEERDIDKLDKILTELEPTWKERANQARLAWEQYLAPDVRYHYIIEQGKKLLDRSNGNEQFFKRKLTMQELYMRFRLSKFGKVINMIKPIIVKIHKLR